MSNKTKRGVSMEKTSREEACASHSGCGSSGPCTSDSGTKQHWQAPTICAALLLAIAFVFGQAIHFNFVNYDDNVYVYDNAQVTGGLTPKNIVWAFTHVHAGNWHPLTSISHMLDCQIYGLAPGRHHLTNLLLHAATTVTLFLVLWHITGALWRSAIVAAVFAIHPLRAESVAWVSERKDVLSGLFFTLTLAAYLRYVRHRFALGRYLTVFLVFALGLLAKPMLVTLPFVLLLLDAWPLGRLTVNSPVGKGFRLRSTTFATRPIIEKLPLFALALASCLATLWAQQEAIVSATPIEFPARLANALVSYVRYLGKFFVPMNLAVYYPHPGLALSTWKVFGAMLILTTITCAAVALRRKHPYALVGWLWYLIMLVPVIGLVQVGSQSMADRYTYLPQIGLVIAIVWGLSDWGANWPTHRWKRSAVSVLVIAVLMACTWRQTSFWKNSETLWKHTLACTSHNVVAHNNLGHFLASHGRLDEAIRHYQKALAINPKYAEAHVNLGNAFAQRGRINEAILQFQKALEENPNQPNTHNDLGVVLYRRGHFAEAIAEYKTALKLDPNLEPTHNNLADLLLHSGKIDDAILHYRKALKLNPTNAEAHCNLANALANKKNVRDAIAHYQRALRLDPNFLEAYNNLAWLRATWPDVSYRNGPKAVLLAQHAAELSHGDPDILDTLAAAYAETGDFQQAITTAEKAIQLAVRQKRQQLANALRARLYLYKAKKPYRKKSSS